MPKLLNRQQLADFLNIKPKSVHAWIHKGWLPHPLFKKGNSPRWDAEEVLKYLKNEQSPRKVA